MTLRFLPFFAFVVAFVPAVRAISQPMDAQGMNRDAWRTSSDVPVLLRKAIREQRQGHYLGRRVVEFLRGPQNLKHDEIVYRDGPRTRVEFPSGSKYSGQVIVETSGERRHYMPDRNVILVLPPRREENFDRLVGLARRLAAKQYAISLEGGEKIANLATDQLTVRDSAGSVIQRLFVEPRSGIVLKRQVFDAKGAQIGFFQFSQINLNPGSFDTTLFRLERSGARIITPLDTLRDIASQENFEPIVFAPTTGYRLEESRITTVQNQKILVEAFGSPKGRLTLFELHSAISSDKLQKLARGDFKVFTWQQGKRTFVLVGPRTQQELGLVAQSIVAGTP